MKYPGLTVFILFFGLSLLDALWGGNWARGMFWLLIGVSFWLMERGWGRKSAS
jgi:hypothetical protein